MSQTQNHDQISIRSIDSAENQSSSDNLSDNGSTKEQENYDFPMQINDSAPRTNKITMNNPLNTNVGDSHNFYGPVTLLLHPKNDELVKNVIKNGDNGTNLEMDCGDEIHQVTIDSGNFEQKSSIILNQQQSTNDPQVNLTVPHETLNHTFGFLISKRLKVTLIIVLAGTCLFLVGMILLGYFLNKNFYDELVT
ncbi:uncharacterized protein LOC134831985 [Culicoides brevitarsis]|uniref:uncharacterized protein LOC134831985 n=1 Tax=Culicoides brevitarsis TaxID=469753 RepID=UPI00307C2299